MIFVNVLPVIGHLDDFLSRRNVHRHSSTVDRKTRTYRQKDIRLFHKVPEVSTRGDATSSTRERMGFGEGTLSLQRGQYGDLEKLCELLQLLGCFRVEDTLT